jgi:hypothetical protein
MALTTVLNVILAIGVVVMVVAPLAWAIVRERREHPVARTAEAPSAPQRGPQPSAPDRRGARPRYKPVAGV